VAELDELRRLVNGYQVTQAIHVAVTVGIPDLLAHGARGSDELAAATESHAPTLYRLLRALASVGILHEDDERRFTLTPLGQGFRSDAEPSLAAWTRFVGRPYHWASWGHLLHGVCTGENAFEHLHGESVWEYRAKHPEESIIFDAAMTALTRLSNEALVHAYDFGRFGVVVDVGGGHGALLAAILDANPRVRGVLFDQPHVVAGAEVGERCDVVAGSFFDAVPEGCDAYMLKSIIHDWEDAEAVAILRVCRRAMRPGATLLVIERELGGPNELPQAKFSDLNMLVATGGRERSKEEYAALFAAAGFDLAGVTPAGSGMSVIEGVAA
jgi:O-methyltransferase/methyltransferase family protein